MLWWAWVVACGLALGLGNVGPLAAGEFNPVLSVGDAAPTWKNLPGVDGKTHSLADLAKKPVVVVVFTCNSCPYAVDYEDRLNEFAKKQAGPTGEVAVVAINANRVAADSLPNMRKRAKEKGFVFPYVQDESQAVAKAYGATRTPEFFVLNAERKIVYMGAMDNNSDAAKATTDYVGPAVAAALKGTSPEVKETVPIGCNIRYARQRRKRDG